MTASIVSPTIASARRRPGSDRLAGVRPLARKEFAEWRHARRAWIVLVISTAFMVLSAANAAITAWIVANLPEGADAPALPTTMSPLENILAGASGQIFVLAAIFATMSLLVAERERGTLAWVASKPVSRGGIWFAKWSSATIVLWVAAALIPLAVTTVVAIGLYGMPPIVPILVVAAGMGASIALFVAVMLAASTVVSSQAAAAAIGFAVFVLPEIVVALVPFEVGPFLPTAILGWSFGLAMGAPVGVVTPIAWAVTVAVLVVVAIRRMEHAEI